MGGVGKLGFPTSADGGTDLTFLGSGDLWFVSRDCGRHVVFLVDGHTGGTLAISTTHGVEPDEPEEPVNIIALNVLSKRSRSL